MAASVSLSTADVASSKTRIGGSLRTARAIARTEIPLQGLALKFVNAGNKRSRELD